MIRIALLFGKAFATTSIPFEGYYTTGNSDDSETSPYSADQEEHLGGPHEYWSQSSTEFPDSLIPTNSRVNDVCRHLCDLLSPSIQAQRCWRSR
jgi:hypothetical protein